MLHKWKYCHHMIVISVAQLSFMFRLSSKSDDVILVDSALDLKFRLEVKIMEILICFVFVILFSDHWEVFYLYRISSHKYYVLSISAGSGCTAYDVVVSPEFMAKMNASELFRTFFLTVMMEGLESKYDIELSRGKLQWYQFLGLWYSWIQYFYFKFYW